MKILVSACLLGENCKYNAQSNKNDAVLKLAEKHKLIPVCPECMAGLPIPRVPSEIKGNRVYSKDGQDLTDKFRDGAEKSLYVAEKSECRVAILKERSPSCGFGEIYDGSFSGRTKSGNGITAQLLYNNGIKIFGESRIDGIDFDNI